MANDKQGTALPLTGPVCLFFPPLQPPMSHYVLSADDLSVCSHVCSHAPTVTIASLTVISSRSIISAPQLWEWFEDSSGTYNCQGHTTPCSKTLTSSIIIQIRTSCHSWKDSNPMKYLISKLSGVFSNKILTHWQNIELVIIFIFIYKHIFYKIRHPN